MAVYYTAICLCILIILNTLSIRIFVSSLCGSTPEPTTVHSICSRHSKKYQFNELINGWVMNEEINEYVEKSLPTTRASEI